MALRAGNSVTRSNLASTKMTAEKIPKRDEQNIVRWCLSPYMTTILGLPLRKHISPNTVAL